MIRMNENLRIKDRTVIEKLESDLLQYIVESKKQPGERLSSLDELSAD